MKYKEWINNWLNNYIKPTVKIKTYNIYKEMINKHLFSELENYELDDITPIIIQKLISKLLSNGNIKTKKGLSISSVNLIITILQSSLKVAYDFGILSQYNANKIKRPKLIQKQIDCFTREEQKKIENYVINDKRLNMLGIILCLYTGLRIGELLALTWDDIDLKNNMIIVNKTCYYGKDFNGKISYFVNEPKTESSKRKIPIPKKILVYINKMKDKSISNYVIEKNGKQVLIRSYQRSFSLLLKKINISHRGFHSLRHTFATRAIELGMDIKTLSEILGHKNAIVTANKYVHSLNEYKIKMMNKLGDFINENFT